MDRESAREVLMGCFRAGVAAVEPELVVARSLGPIETNGRVVVFALGKAAPAMARGAVRALGTDHLDGIVVSNHSDRVPPGIELLIGGHPVPDQRSMDAGRSLLARAARLTGDDVALVLISGGGSALAEVPVPGVSIVDLARTNELLLRSGADIVDTNTVRCRLSLLKGGGLAVALAPARVITLVISDVIGDPLEVIASGPTTAGTHPPGAAMEVVRRLELQDALPPGVAAVLQRPPRPIELLPPQDTRIVASGAMAAHAAAQEAERRGYPAAVLDTRLAGEASVAAGEALDRSRGSISVFAGETTVTVTGGGVGGRNHEAALAAATIVEGQPDVFFLAAGTDGIDGMTDAAGAVADGTTVGRGRAQGFSAAQCLRDNDSGTFFAALGDQICTGPTGTNVGDLWLVLRSD